MLATSPHSFTGFATMRDSAARTDGFQYLFPS